MSEQFPKTIYVQAEQDDGVEYLLAEKSVETLDEELKMVGVYQLVEVKKFKVERKLV